MSATLTRQHSRKPTRKVAAVGITGAIGTVIAYALGVDEETAGAMATLVVLIVVAGYGTRDKT